MGGRQGLAVLLGLGLLSVGCSTGDASAPPVKMGHDASPGTDGGHDAARDAQACTPSTCTEVLMDFTGGSTFFDSPFPSDARLTSAGLPDLSGFPNNPPVALATSVLALAQNGPRAFGTTSSIYFRFTSAVSSESAATLYDPHPSLSSDATVFIIDVDPGSPALGKRSAARGLFLANAGPFGASNLFAVLPYQGVPLLPATRYAAVILTTLLDSHGRPLGVAPAMALLAQGEKPEGMSAAAFSEYQDGLTALKQASVDVSTIAGMTVFTTDTPTADYEKVKNAMLALPVPQISGPWVPYEVFPSYCVYQSTIPMPEYQGGVAPYSTAGGGWVFDSSGNPVLQGYQQANIVVTIPRTTMPTAGYPLTVMSRTGAGGNRPLVDRGTQATNGGPPIVAGSGPAMYYAAAGFAGMSIDGPLGGLRNPTDPDTANNEDYTVFNVANPVALRDNVRQSAAELSLAASIASSLTLNVTACPGANTPEGGPARFDAGTLAIMSHSMGSTISPLTLAFEPRYRAAILSGAGGSWIENIVYKLDPLPLQPILSDLLGISPGSGYTLGEGDPLVNMFQWAAESADAPVYDSRTIHHPVDAPAHNVLKVQGIIDHYILPPICNATTLSLGLDLAGPELDSTTPGLASYTPLDAVIDLSGRKLITLPAAGNVTTVDGGLVTAIVTQHPSDGIEDGHEVIFQTDPPKHEYMCFLLSLAAGQTPLIPADAPALSPCQ
jgi:hypothetical protein